MAPNDPNLKYKKMLEALCDTGLYDTTNLPAVVVCGDQSSGKSSTLEALSGLHFPIADGMCTRCVTIVEMGRSDTFRLSAHIVPSDHRSRPERNRLTSWRLELSDTTEMGRVITTACEVMGSKTTQGFLRDTLIIKMTSPIVPMFTLIDVPGLIQSASDGQQEADIAYIQELVKGYMADESKIILTVVAANTDLELQGVLRLAKQIDPHGTRAIGVITKPDACHDRPSIQAKALQLLSNKGDSKYQWDLGWHLLKNPSNSQTNLTREERDALESQFLARKPWDGVPDKFKGAESLSNRLETQILELFMSRMPTTAGELRTKIEDVKAEMELRSPDKTALATARAQLESMVASVQDELVDLLSKLEWGSGQTFVCELEDAATDLFHLMEAHAHFYEFDRGCLMGMPRQLPVSLQSVWNVPPSRPVQELRRLAERVITDAKAEVGQVTEPMYHRLFNDQVQHWPLIMEQYIDKVKSLLQRLMADAVARIVPDDMQVEVQNVVVTPRVDEFAQSLRLQVPKLTQPNTLRRRQVAEANTKAWKAQYHETEQQRLKEVCGVGNLTATQNLRLEYQSVAKRLAALDVEPESFPARQAIALMQELYEERIEYMKPRWNEKIIKKRMADLVEDLTSSAMRGLTDEQLGLIYPEVAVNDEDLELLTELRVRINKYYKALIELEEL